MDISAQIASKLYGNAQSALKPLAGLDQKSTPSTLANFSASFVGALQENEAAVKAGLAGRADAQTVVEALAATEIAVQTAVSVRDKVVEAYQEILRMPV